MRTQLRLELLTMLDIGSELGDRAKCLTIVIILYLFGLPTSARVTEMATLP